MKSRKRLVATILVSALALTGVLAGAAAVSADSGDSPRRAGNALMARVADILGIDQSDLESAFDQALQEEREQRQEEMQTALETRLRELVDEGVLTEEQVDEYQAWLESRPDNRDEMKEWLEARPDFGIESGAFGGSRWFGASDGMTGAHRGPVDRVHGCEGQCPALEEAD